MDCTNARAALSARLDGEPVPEAEPLRLHLAGCADCRSWHQRAEALSRTAETAFASVPDLTVGVLEAASAAGSAAAARSRARARVLRWAVGVAAVAQLVLAIPALLAATGLSDFSAVHASREMASFDIAVAVGFLLAAIRPERARAFVPVACVLAICLAATSGIDMASGATALADETGHIVAAVQAVLLWALGRVHPRDGSAAARTVTA